MAYGGFTAQVGGGVQGIVWKSLYVGGEADLDLNFYFDAELQGLEIVDVRDPLHSLAFELTVGWVF